ncbi:C45 family peptidase [Pseudotabrizicola sp. L79]|uniref:C45 family peptidase n=1 Tax=Pseudotabrizicola sp. L79 TaxID=3118402 RepID=UPI002F94A598
MTPQLTRLDLKGEPFAIGLGLGLVGRSAVQRLLLSHPLWAEVNSATHAKAVARMAETTQVRFHWIWAEIEGLAQGLGLPPLQVFAWNCRGDLLAMAPDGCTTVMQPGPTITLAHNEDGFPFFRGQCFLADLDPDGQPGLTSFAYPGSIVGHTFAMTHAGLVQTVNNIRLVGVAPEIPRMVLGRAVLACETLDQAVHLLQTSGPSGGFHFGLAQAGDDRLLSVEFGKGGVSVHRVTAPMAHANHALHLSQGQGQIITQSSADRQLRADDLLHSGHDPLSILRDAAGPGLPIRRDAQDDPDEENTIATLLAQIGADGVRWAVHPDKGPAILGHIRPAGPNRPSSAHKG